MRSGSQSSSSLQVRTRREEGGARPYRLSEKRGKDFKAPTGHKAVASSLGGTLGGSVLSLYGSVVCLPLAVLGINDGSEYNNTKDQSSAGRPNWPRCSAQSSPLRAPLASASKTNVLYGTASNDEVAEGSNGAKVNAWRTSPKTHMGMGEGNGGLLL